MDSSLIPENKKGKQNDLQYAVEFATKNSATEYFKIACERLLHPAVWHELAGKLSAKFILYDAEKNMVNRSAQENDFLKIDIPGPGTEAGKGFDWVKIIAINKTQSEDGEEESFAMKVQPCSSPLNDNESTAHFFTSESSSTFLIERIRNKIVASYHGRNEIPNTETENAIDKLRNTLVATGAFFGLSELQWKALIKGLLSD